MTTLVNPDWFRKVKEFLQEKVEQEYSILAKEKELEDILQEAKISQASRRRILSEAKYHAAKELNVHEWEQEDK